MLFLLFIGAIVIFFLVLNLRDRVQKLEQMMRGNVAKIAPEPNREAIPSQPPIKQPTEPITPTGPTTSQRFVAWLKEDWLMKLGAMLLLIGFGWLTTYAFLNNWIGPMGRIALGIVAGALFIMLNSIF